MTAELHVIDGSNAGRIFRIDVEKFLMGREADCHLRPSSELASRHHCVIIDDGYNLRLRDLGSMNGTFINGRRIESETVLAAGDILNVGDMTIRLVVLDETADESSPSREGTEDAALNKTAVFDGNTVLADKDTQNKSAEGQSPGDTVPLEDATDFRMVPPTPPPSNDAPKTSADIVSPDTNE